MYRPPQTKYEWYNYFELELSRASLSGNNLVIMGDFNINLLVNTPDHTKWRNLFESYGLSQVSNLPTRMTNTSASLIDHIYTSGEQVVKDICVSNISLSDHAPVGITWKSNFCNSVFRSSLNSSMTEHIERISIWCHYILTAVHL